MKKMNIYIYLLVSGVTLLTSCASDIAADPESGERIPAEVIAEINGNGTRATATQFETDDRIGITVTGNNGGTFGETDLMYRYQNVRYTRGTDGKFNADESGGLFFENSDTYTYKAYYPFYGTPGADQNFEINTFDSQNETARKNLDIMVAENTDSKNETDNRLSFTGTSNSFTHQMSKVVFRVSLDNETFKDYEDERIPEISTYLENCIIQVTGLVHAATFDTRQAILTADSEADTRIWNLATAEAPRRVYSISTDASGNAVTSYKVLEYEVMVIPQNTSNVRMALVYEDGTKFESDAFQVLFEAGKAHIVEMKVHRRNVSINLNTGLPFFENWKDGDSGSVETPTGEK